MIRFVDQHQGRFGVEPLISVLRATDAGFLSVSGYYAAKKRPPSSRAIADAALCEQISAVHQENYSVYGAARCTTRCAAPASQWAATTSPG